MDSIAMSKASLTISSMSRCMWYAAQLLGLCIFMGANAQAADTLRVSGPIDAVDYARQAFVVLGQPVVVSANTSFYYGSMADGNHAVVLDRRALRLIGPGSYIAVWADDGPQASAILISQDRFVPGATSVFISGV